jgi:glycosyltransferase involved in cell wall biosynthesis
MRRLIVVQLLPALSSGGVERSTLEIAEALVAAGHGSVVVSAGGRLVDALQTAGSRHVCLDIGRKSLSTLRHVLSLRRLFAELQPDIVHARSRLPAWLARIALAGWRGKRPHFLTSVHGLNSPGWYSAILTRGERVICVSPTVRAHVLRHWPRVDPDKMTVIEPGIDPQVFSPTAPAAGVAAESAPAAGRAPDEKLLLMPGRGTRLKGHADAIALLAALHAAGNHSRLCLLGARETGREAYVAELEAMAASLGVAEFVEISAPSADIVQAYQHCDLVLQLSTKPEAFGRTVVEALSIGKPVAGWAHGGVGELLQRYFPEGRVAPGDQQALLATTLALLTKPRPPIRIFPQTLATMQAQTLKTYESLAG